jgi:hypothetical protein
MQCFFTVPVALRTLALAVCALAFSACGASPQDRLNGGVEALDLIDLLPSGEVRAGSAEYVSRIPIPVAGEERHALFMHPTSRVTYPPIRMTLTSRLELSFGVSEKAWGEIGDGVRFSVFASRPGTSEVRIFSTYLDPKHEERDRRWADAIVTLGTFAGEDVALALETDPGPAGDAAFDWAAWSRAVVYRSSE